MDLPSCCNGCYLIFKTSILSLNLIFLLAFYSYEVFHYGCVPVFKAHVHLRLPHYECICLNLNSNHRQGLIVQENVEGKASKRTGTNNDVKICCVHPFLEYHFQHTEKVQHILYHYLNKSTRFFIIILKSPRDSLSFFKKNSKRLF